MEEKQKIQALNPSLLKHRGEVQNNSVDILKFEKRIIYLHYKLSIEVMSQLFRTNYI